MSKYWEERSLLREQKAKEKGDAFLKKLEESYKKTESKIQKEIQTWFFNYANEQGISLDEARRRLSKKELLKYQESIEELIASAKGEEFQSYLRKKYFAQRIERLKSLKNQISIQLDILSQSNDIKMFQHLKEVYKENLVLNPATISIETGFRRFSEIAIEEVVLEAWSGMSFSERIWKNTEKLTQEMTDVLSSGIMQGHGIDKMAQKLSKRMGVNFSRAKTLVRTETNRVFSEATFDSYEQFQLEKYQFLATLDYKTSEICQNLDRKIFFVKDRKIGVNCNPMHPNCRSTTVPFFGNHSGKRIARGSDGKTYYVDEGISYKEWYNSLSDDERARMELLKKKEKFKSSDKEQFKKYQEVAKKETPKSFAEFQNLKYTNHKKYDALKRTYRDGKLKRSIRENYNLSINRGKQDKHIKTANNYKQELAKGNRKSYLLDDVDPQRLVERYAGTGEIRRNPNGKWIEKQFFESEKPIGYFVNQDTGEESLTNRFAIHYSKKKGTHIVPVKPLEKE